MRTFIFDFEQDKLVALGLDIKQTLVLDYINKLSKSGRMKSIRQGEKTFYWIKYSKLQEDLPILGVSNRQLYTVINKMVNIGVLEKFTYSNRQMYVRIAREKYENACLKKTKTPAPNDSENEGGRKLPTDIIAGRKLPTETILPEENFIVIGSKLLAIVNYNNNNIFINITEGAALKLDKNYFLEQLKNRLKQEFSPVSYDLIYKDATIEKQKYTLA